MTGRKFADHLLFGLFLAASGTALSQVVFRDAFPDAGWGVIEAPQDHFSAVEQAALWQTIQSNIGLLRAQGRIADLKANLPLLLSWPTRFAPGRPEVHDHAISYFVDHDPAINSPQDFSCGTRTYDFGVPGAGHTGTDIVLGVRPFYEQDSEQVVVVAAAPGVIVAKDDTHPDRSCGDLSTLLASTTLTNNEISIRHADGSVAMYVHIKAGSLTAKNVGESVVEGEYLAAVGSAGFSTGPHLHFELRSATNAVIDPWLGACNPTTTVSLWRVQEPYHTQEILDMMPSSTIPTATNMDPTCTNSIADPKAAAGYLQPNLYAQPRVLHNFIGFLRDLDAGTPITLALYRPDGSQYTAAAGSGSGYVAIAFIYINATIPATEPAGKWSFAMTYGGTTRAVPFYFNIPVPAPIRVYEFYNSALDHYFRTASAAEAQSLTPDSGFLATGDDFIALDRSVGLAAVSPVCRFYGSTNPGPNSHFYTANAAECASLESIQAHTSVLLPRWNYEETAFTAYQPVAGLCPTEAPFPIYRLYNQHAGEIVAGVRDDSNHRFTTFSSVYNQMGAKGWAGEGVVMCAESKP